MSHSYKTLPIEKEDRTFRCVVSGDTKGLLTVDRTVIRVQVRETAGSGFTIGVKPKHLKKIRSGRRIELRFRDRRCDVRLESFADELGGETRLRMATIREHEPKERWGFRLPFTRANRIASHDMAFHNGAAYGGFVMVLFIFLALPGIGDELGTAPRIHAAIEMIRTNLVDVYNTVVK